MLSLRIQLPRKRAMKEDCIGLIKTFDLWVSEQNTYCGVPLIIYACAV